MRSPDGATPKGSRPLGARGLHRWAMTVAALLLLYWIGTGLLLAVYDASDATQGWAKEGGGPGARLGEWAAAAAPTPDPALFRAGISRALQDASAMPVASVDYRMTAAGPRLQLAEADGSRATERRFYAATGAPMSEDVADGDDRGPPPDNGHRYLKSWHRGNIAGLPGQLLGLVAGAALLTLTISGALVYWRMWRGRARIGRGGLLWFGKGSLWRSLHRCIALVSLVLVLNIAISGLILAWGEIQVQVRLQYGIGAFPYPRPTPLPPVSDAPLGVAIAPALERAYAAAQTLTGAAPVAAIDLVHRDGLAKAIVTLVGPGSHMLALDARTGRPVKDWALSGVQRGQGYFADWHQIVKRIHRFDILGDFAARYLDIATGLALLYLTVSGIVMYFDLRSRRKRAQQGGWFWR